MNAPTKTIIVLVCITIVLAGGSAWAQEAEPPPATPEEVLRQFSELSDYFFADLESLRPVLSQESIEALSQQEQEIVGAVLGLVLLPELKALETVVEGERCTVTAVGAPRAVEVKLVREGGQWKVDLLATLLGIEELLWQAGAPETPGDVVRLFSVLTPAAACEPDVPVQSLQLLRAAFEAILSEPSRAQLQELREDLVWLLWERLEADDFELISEEVRVEGDTAAVLALSYPGVQRIKLVREHGDWKIDLVATVEEMTAAWEEEYEVTECLSNVKQIAVAFLMYASDNVGDLPPADTWMDEILPYMMNEEMLRCPEAPEQEYGYAFNANLSEAGPFAIDNPSEIVLIFDSNLGTRNAAGGPEAVADPPRHESGNNYGFMDGHAKRSSEVPDFGKAPEPSMVVRVNEANFEREVLSSEVPVVLGLALQQDTTARALLNELAAEYGGKVKFCLLYLYTFSDGVDSIERNYGTPLISSLILFADGEEMDRRGGWPTTAEIKTWLEGHLRP